MSHWVGTAQSGQGAGGQHSALRSFAVSPENAHETISVWAAFSWQCCLMKSLNGGIVGSLQPPAAGSASVSWRVVEPSRELSNKMPPAQTVVPMTPTSPLADTSRAPPVPPRLRVLEAISSDAVAVTVQPALAQAMFTWPRARMEARSILMSPPGADRTTSPPGASLTISTGPAPDGWMVMAFACM